MKNAVQICALLALNFLCSISVSAELHLPALFTDHMVIQRDTEVPVWGWADPGANVKVSLNSQWAESTAGPDGRWQVKLGALPAGGPHRIVIQSGNEALTIRDVLVGEVWIGSGQSNMQWPVQQTNNAELEIRNADYDNIRLFYVPRETAESPQDDVMAEWTECNSDTIPGFSAVAYYFGRELHDALNVPIGLIHTSWGGTPAESWTSRPSLEAYTELRPILDRWDGILESYPAALERFEEAMERHRERAKEASENGEDPPSRPRAPIGPDHPHRPASLYNGMLAPLIPYAFRGAIWYQGESNAGRAYQYRTLFPAMINDWRRAWGGRNFPFLFVQLANFRQATDNPNEPSDWAELREAQSMALDLDNTGMAVIIDIGEADDIHPRNKQDVGRRLAAHALANTYGKDVPSSGPLLKSKTVEEGAIRLSFDHVYDGLEAHGAELRGFAIAGVNRQFYWADAKIDGDTVVVSSNEVPNPVAVRFGWADNPPCNLYNSAGLPASPFRTDDWYEITRTNR